MVQAIKVFKKKSPNGKITAYLSRRDFSDRRTHTDPIDGVVVVDADYLQGRKVFARVLLTYRYGREEDEVMGLKFSKEFELVHAEVLPPEGDQGLTPIQEKVVKKLGGSAMPFSVSLPDPAPCSVALDPGSDESSKMLGVSYELSLYVSGEKEETLKTQDTVTFSVRKVQYAPIDPDHRQPQLLVHRNYTLSPGRIILDITLGRDIYFHGDEIEADVTINNSSKKTVKSIMAEIIQHVDITMTNMYYTRVVASLESRDGCPIVPGASLTRSIGLRPVIGNTSRFGVALDGQVKDKDASLGSSTLCNASSSVNDCLGILLSYSFRLRLNCGAIGGEVSCELPFKLMHPDPSAPTEEDDLEFEDFARFRRGKSLDELE
ncbi:arrestin homolog [Penaeus japonicus]|uniref:arrestin homolog n=1 Tax=Penaeus japonicus TaxID=27405 RepID=UPI001C70C026|nr:arrestin homolog [Penaeus japonicus]